MNLNTPEINQLKAKTKITLESFDEAYEAQFSRMVSDKIMEMESELQVARQIMSDAGICDDACSEKQECYNRPRGRFQK